MPNDGRITVACPNCSSTGTYDTTIKSSDGDTIKTCKSCNKQFNIKLRKGDVYKVTKK